MDTRMTFQAWRIGGDPVAISIPSSPAGPIHVRSYTAGRSTIPEPGCAVVLPTRRTVIAWPHVEFDIGPGCFAQVPGGASLRDGAGLVIHTPQYAGLYQAGGPVEDVGRLKYIDGCSDSLLICPAKIGDPCLNLLHLPASIAQTEHTHPSDRIGIILRGAGTCRTAAGDTPLRGGMFWYIPPEYAHSFHTGPEESLDVLAWHPDSDFGPSHDAHPMINRTIVEGVSAADARHGAIRTTDLAR
jgi:mannose-6-phosphate isomerase-like protein (cupin superfamily)